LPSDHRFAHDDLRSALQSTRPPFADDPKTNRTRGSYFIRRGSRLGTFHTTLGSAFTFFAALHPHRLPNGSQTHGGVLIIGCSINLSIDRILNNTCFPFQYLRYFGRLSSQLSQSAPIRHRCRLFGRPLGLPFRAMMPYPETAGCSRLAPRTFTDFLLSLWTDRVSPARCNGW
jgi:hypothetical protein